MSSGFPGSGGQDFCAGRGIINGRSTPLKQNLQAPALAGIVSDSASHVHRTGTNFIGKRSHHEFQQQLQHMDLHNLRNAKPRVNYQHTSPISPLPPADFSAFSSLSPDMSSLSSITYSPPMNSPYSLPNLLRLPIQQQLRNFTPPVNNFSSVSSISLPNLVQNQRKTLPVDQQLLFLRDQSDKKMMNRLQELEKQLLDDDDIDNPVDALSAVTDSDWSETIQNLNLIAGNQKPISPSPTSSSSSCSSTSASPPITCPKQSISEAATAIADGKTEVASEILTRLSQFSNPSGTSEQRLTAYMVSALRSRLNPTENSFSELYSTEHMVSSQMLYDVSPCFKLGFMAANFAILESISDQPAPKLHILDFDVGHGGQYVHLLHGLAAKKSENPAVLKISAFTDLANGGEERLKAVGDGLKVLANRIKVSFNFVARNLNVMDLSHENLDLKDDDALVVNCAFKLYKYPDESVTTENQRDELLRRVKALSPKVVTVVEQEMNANTAPFVARVKEAWEYNGVLFDSLDATVSGESLDRVRVEEGLGRKMRNSVACEGRDRVERCELFGKWRARMSMAGFQPKPVSALVADSLRSKLNPGTRSNPGFTVNEQSGGICFGWKGRTLTVASAWH